MRDWGGAFSAQGRLAETLGLAMARRAADILSRHRDPLTGTHDDSGQDGAQYAADDAVFAAVLDAANECLGRFDGRPVDDRWCDALLQILRLADLDRTGAAGAGTP
ncbi:MAG TPA: hypothetical protein VF060_00250 [Trebonia sp.]